MNTYANNEIPVIKKVYTLYKTFYEFSKLFPKKDKYVLGSKCEEYIIATLELLLAASSAPKNEKQIFIKQANIKFDALKIFIRIANDIRMLDTKKYIAIQKQLQEIGRMLGGWQKSLN
ncbi:MAG: hypothetical protein US25_C0037G0004 [Candidatus Moranbacteria bacterium GW2011_GWE1_36_7]|nr:MAG: hypothetical protein UR99_C0002G0034 [Candidatus Moranbacteria bacterium GW2011_GWD2_36_12]KKQ07059.1 MAG: hypothetical protein US16_C0003G0034 [Candidatus Moranbacteria bacterium GW2011_GWE2_36_40]KKQ13609.1 MAG: hypothetical protein US25_C0037G0004 [Candidatus Moranbacteria bacterium GW2011_GWE1_36_7]